MNKQTCWPKLSSEYDSQWVCKGSQKGGGAFAHWHILRRKLAKIIPDA